MIKEHLLIIKTKNKVFTASHIKNWEWLMLEIKNAYSVKLQMQSANVIIIVYIVLFIYFQINRKQGIIKQRNY